MHEYRRDAGLNFRTSYRSLQLFAELSEAAPIVLDVEKALNDHS